MDAWRNRKSHAPVFEEGDTGLERSNLKMRAKAEIAGYKLTEQNRQNTIPPETLETQKKMTEKGMKQMCRYRLEHRTVDRREMRSNCASCYITIQHPQLLSFFAFASFGSLAAVIIGGVQFGLRLSAGAGSCTLGMVLYPVLVGGRDSSGLLGGEGGRSWRSRES